MSVALAALATAATAQNPKPSPNAPPANGAPGKGPETPAAPKPYAEVITAHAITDSGVFITHQLNDKLFYEIPHAMFGKEFLMVAAQRGAAHGVRFAGEEVSDQVVKWERLGNRVFLRIVLFDIRADSANPVARAVDLSNIPPIVASFDIAAFSPKDSNVVVDVTKLFTTDVGEFNIKQQRVKVKRLDPSRSAVARVRSFPRNVEVSALQTFEVDSVPGQGEAINSLTVLMNYSMVLLPDAPMMPRLCDKRVGYFNLNFEDYDQLLVPRDQRCYIARFRLEPKDPTAAVSRSGEAHHLLRGSGDAGQVGAVDHQGHRAVAANVQSGGLQQRDHRQARARERQGFRSRRRALQQHPLAALHH